MKFFLLVLTLLPTEAIAGNELGNGGDNLAQEFVATGHRILEELKSKPDPAISDKEALARAVSDTKVFTMDKLLNEGREVDALNYPSEGRIELNRSRWKDYDVSERRALVLHEYLGICCDRSDRNYEISSSFTEVNLAEVHASHHIDLQLHTGAGTRYIQSSSSGPFYGISLGYELSPRSTIGLSFDTFAYDAQNVISYIDHQRIHEFGTFYKYWLSDSRVWRPYLAATAGIARIYYDSISNDDYGDQTIWKSPYSRSYIFGTIGPGLNYRLTHTVGVDVAILLHTLHDTNPPKKNSNFVAGQIGMNLFL